MNNLVAIKPTDNKLKQINWNITKRCNNDCSYCPTTIHDNYSQTPNLKDLKTAATNIFKWNEPKNCYISISGGEPTTVKPFKIFIKWLTEQGISKITTISNGTASANYYIDLLHYINHLTISYHFESTDDAVLLPKLEKIFKVHSNKINVQIMVSALHYVRLYKVAHTLKSLGINYTFRLIHKPLNTPSFIPEMIDYNENIMNLVHEQEPKVAHVATALDDNMEEHIIYSSNAMIQENLNHFKNWKCNAGLDFLHIYSNGDVSNATCQVGGILGNVYKNISYNKYPVICTAESCTCGPEILLKKIKNDKFKDYIND